MRKWIALVKFSARSKGENGELAGLVIIFLSRLRVAHTKSDILE